MCFFLGNIKKIKFVPESAETCSIQSSSYISPSLPIPPYIPTYRIFCRVIFIRLQCKPVDGLSQLPQLCDFSDMGDKMCFQVMREAEWLITGPTLVWPLPTMDEQMLLKISSLCEWFVTAPTLVWLNYAMSEKMCLQMSRSNEWLITGPTLEWLLSAMGENMCLQVYSLSEWLVTGSTLMWFLSAMGDKMFL